MSGSRGIVSHSSWWTSAASVLELCIGRRMSHGPRQVSATQDYGARASGQAKGHASLQRVKDSNHASPFYWIVSLCRLHDAGWYVYRNTVRNVRDSRNANGGIHPPDRRSSNGRRPFSTYALGHLLAMVGAQPDLHLTWLGMTLTRRSLQSIARSTRSFISP